MIFKYRRLISRYRQFILFATIGAAGFVVDAGTLTLFIAAGLGPLLARLPSFLLAATFTWACNRHITFRYRGASLVKQWLHFLAVNALGGLVNLSVYAFLMRPNGIVSISPITAVAAGSLSGLIFNFSLSKKLVFKDVAVLSRK